MVAIDKVNVLKSIEIDVEKKIYKVNGVDFGHRCSGFSIICNPEDGISMEIDARISFESKKTRAD